MLVGSRCLCLKDVHDKESLCAIHRTQAYHLMVTLARDIHLSCRRNTVLVLIYPKELHGVDT